LISDWVMEKGRMMIIICSCAEREKKIVTVRVAWLENKILLVRQFMGGAGW